MAFITTTMRLVKRLAVAGVLVTVFTTSTLAAELPEKHPLREWEDAAAHGDAGAQYDLGSSYATGILVPKDYAKAEKWYRKAAEQGHAEAQHSLGDMYRNGQSYYLSSGGTRMMYPIGQRPWQDLTEAEKWYRKAAARGHVKAQSNLGYMYTIGQGVPRDYAKAAKWYKRAAAQGDVSAQYFLGTMYAKGRAVPQDYVLAHMWFNLAAAQRYDEAAKNRDTVAKKMTPAQIAEAQKMAREWKPKSE